MNFNIYWVVEIPQKEDGDHEGNTNDQYYFEKGKVIMSSKKVYY